MVISKSNPEYNLVLFGAQNLVNNKSDIEDTDQRSSAENAIYSEERSRDHGAIETNIKVESRQIKMKGELSVPDNLLPYKSLYDITEEYDRELNRQGRYLRFMRYFRTINELNDKTLVSGSNINNIDDDLLDYQFGTKSVKFDIAPAGSALTNGDFTSATGTEDDDTTDVFNGWTTTTPGSSYADKRSDGTVKIYRDSAETNIYQDVFLNANTTYMFSFLAKSDGTGTAEVQMIVQDGTDEYVADDGTTWSASANDIADLAVASSETSMIRKNFIFTTKSFTGKYRIQLESATNAGAVFLDDVSINQYSNEKIFYAKFDTVYIYDKDGTELGTSVISATNEVQIVEMYTFANGNTFILFMDDDPDFPDDDIYKFTIINSSGAVVVSTTTLYTPGGATTAEQQLCNAVEDSSGNLHLIFHNGVYAKISSAGSILAPANEFDLGGYSGYGGDNIYMDEANNRIIYTDFNKIKALNLSDYSVTTLYTGTSGTFEALIKNTDGKWWILHNASPTYSYLILNSDFTVNTALTTLRTATYQTTNGTGCRTSDGRVWFFYTILESNSDRRIYWKVFNKDGTTSKAEAQLTTYTNIRQETEVFVSDYDRVYFTHVHNTGDPTYQDQYRLTVFDPDYTVVLNNDYDVVSGKTAIDEFTAISGYSETVTTTNANLIVEGFDTIDLTNMAGTGSLCTWLRVPYAENITSLSIRIGSDESNYYSYTVNGDYEFNGFHNGWNFIVFDWENVTTVGTPDDSDLDHITLIFTFNNQTDPITNCAINGFIWNDEDQTRNYRATRRKFDKEDEHSMITYTPFKAEFFAKEGIAFGTFQKTILENAIMAGTPIEQLVEFGGSYNPKPQVRIDVAQSSGLAKIRLDNYTTGQYIQVWKDAEGNQITWQDDDVVIFDFENAKITRNGAEIRFEGGLLDFILGYNTLGLSATNSGDASQEYTTYNSHLSYPSDPITYASRSFIASASGFLTKAQVRGYRSDESYSLTDFEWYLCADSAGDPGAVLAQGTFDVDSTTQKWFEITVNYPVTNGTKYHLVIQMRRYWNPDFGLYLISNFNWSQDTAQGDVNSDVHYANNDDPTGSPTWNGVSTDLTFKADISVTPSYSLSMDVSYQKKYL